MRVTTEVAKKILENDSWMELVDYVGQPYLLNIETGAEIEVERLGD